MAAKRKAKKKGTAKRSTTKKVVGRKSASKATKKTAKPSGRKRGRPVGSTNKGGSKSDKIRVLLAEGLAPAAIAKKLDCSAGLVYQVKSSLGGGRKKAPGRRGRKAAASASLAGMDGLLAGVRLLEKERDHYREALAKIQRLLDDVL